MTPLPNVLLISSGGTIAGRTTTDGVGYDPTLGGAEILASVRGYEKLANVRVLEWKNKASYALSLDEMMELVSILEVEADNDALAGIVITIGTAAMEEVGFLIDLLLLPRIPIVITGAMINASRLGHDGPRNIRDALRIAAHPDARGTGVLVCMAGEVHSAREVRKLHKSSTDAFQSWPNGPLALADVDRVVWLRAPRRTERFVGGNPVGPVDIVPASLGSDDRQMISAIESGAKGIVIEGFPGGGGVTEPMMAAVATALERNLPVVLASRSPFGRSVAGAGGGSGPKDLAAAGVILAGDLFAHKARLLLMCALGETAEIDRIRAIFKEVSP